MLGRLRESIRSGRSDFRIIVPTKTLEHHLRNRLAREGLVFRPELVQTLSGFTEPLAAGLRAVSPATRHLMVQAGVARTNRPEFAKVASMPGFHASLTQTLDELDMAGCNPDRLHSSLRHAPLGAALLAVWREVENEMKARGLATRAQRLQRAAERLRLQGMAPVQAVAFEGFAQFSGPELAFVQAAGECFEVIVTPFEPGPAHTVPRHFVPGNIEREADEIARRIVLESENGTPFREMGVILRNPDAYRPVLQAAFQRFGIPARFYFDEPLREHAVTQFVAGLVDAKLAGWEHEQILAALRLSPKTGVSAAMDRLDIALRKQLPNSGLEKLFELAASDELLLALLDACRNGLAGGPNPRELFRPGKIPDEVSWDTAFAYRGQAEALSAFEKVIEEAGEWHGGDVLSRKPAPFRVFWQTVKTILGLTPLRVPDGRRNVLHVLSAYEARQWELTVVFVPGLVEGQFPKHHPQNAFLPDSAVRHLQSAGILLRTSEDRDAEERFLFDSAIARATGQVFLSYPHADSHGEPNVPSTFLNDMAANEACTNVRPAPMAGPDRFRPASAISSPNLLRILDARHAAISASSLESYLQCPFQFFATKTLRLREFPPAPEDRMDFLIRGNIIHRFLAEWFIGRSAFEPLFDQIFEEACRENCVPFGYRTEMWRHRMLQDVERFCTEDGWPRGAEIETEVKFDFPLDGSTTVNGRIDRLERLGDDFGIVIDYKYSKADKAKKLIENETKLQAPIYLLALERAFGLKPLAMVYYSLRGSLDMTGRGSVPGLKTEWEPITPEWLHASAVTILESVRQMRAGRILPAPATIEPCRYCDVKDVCRYEPAAALAASGE